MNAATIISFFQGFIPDDFSSTTKDQANKSLHFFAQVWQDLYQELQKFESTKFKVDTWKQGGQGVLAIVDDGVVFSKANIAISIVTGKVPLSGIQQLHEAAKLPTSLTQSRTFTEDHSFLGISLNAIIHGKNPHVPTLHFNLRHVVMKLGNDTEVGWYGGVVDLNPAFLEREDAVHFHKTLKEACDKHDARHYPRFKKWCDDYFYIPHREEFRGIGGIFFDNLKTDKEGNFQFLETCGKAVLPAYIPILKRRFKTTFTDREMEWKQYRNSRYIEFNLIHDKGMKFGFEFPGFPVEVLFSSLPNTAKWSYKGIGGGPKVKSGQKPNSREEELERVLRTPQTWA